VGFLFIPIVAIANHLTLSEIAILFAVMRVPYLVNFFTGEFADRYNKKTLLLIVTIFLSFLYALLGYNENF
jgi:MFS family permease